MRTAFLSPQKGGPLKPWEVDFAFAAECLWALFLFVAFVTGRDVETSWAALPPIFERPAGIGLVLRGLADLMAFRAALVVRFLGARTQEASAIGPDGGCSTTCAVTRGGVGSLGHPVPYK